MNLYTHGEHAAADWLLVKLRSRPGALAVHIEDDGQLTTREARRERGADSLVGVYRLPVRYGELVDDLSYLREQRRAA